MNRNLLSLPCLTFILWAAALLPAETIRQDFNSMTELNAFWDKSSWTGDNRTHSPANVTIDSGILVLKLSGSQPGQLPVCAEITSKRNNFLYGSYRASIKTTNIAGAVVGWFVYRGSPLNEIDVEFLTENITQVHYTLHHVQTNVDYKAYKISFDPSAAFHEYRFDWYPDSVRYFIDGKFTYTLKNQVPNMACRIMLNHWSGNIAGWGGKTPTQDVFMYVDYMEYSSEYGSTTAAGTDWSANKEMSPVCISYGNSALTVLFRNPADAPQCATVVTPLGRDVWTGASKDGRGRFVINTGNIGRGIYIFAYNTPTGKQRRVFTLGK